MWKKITKFTLIFSVLLLLTSFFLILFAKSDFNKSFDEKQLEKLILNISSSEKIPDSFFKLYDSLENITNTNGVIYGNIINKNSSCPCLQVSQFHSNLRGKNLLFGNEYILAWKLEKKVTQKDCLQYFLEHTDFLYGNIGIQKASDFFYQKPLIAIDESQKIVLIKMMRNPYLFNPMKNEINSNETILNQ